jgi:alpha-amylase/alpha-mannosidase (GH57 family)
LLPPLSAKYIFYQTYSIIFGFVDYFWENKKTKAQTQSPNSLPNMKSQKYLCIHGHFYQPPRENAWLEAIEVQDSAHPFHDWNERINFECYAPNTAARLLDGRRHIIDIVNNYAQISSNFGPTLLSWMEKADPGAYQSILQADKESQQRFGGHGSAMAQVYGHLILPLANRRDKGTQVIWGIRDFEYRFGRKPQGMWLAETAADTESLEVLAENGIQFTVLAPRQGKAIRKIGDKDWQNLPPDSIDPRRAYRCNLPSGKTIDLFFYHGGIAQDVAFKGLLNDGVNFANAIAAAFENIQTPQLIHVATDGESYGHHHRYGEMALASCLHHIAENTDIQLINYAQFLEKFPPEWEVQIHENSSWSCVHGVERWRSNCGCNSGGRPGWTQAWRAPLRETLNWLRDELIPIYELKTKDLLQDPWEARNTYIQVVLHRSQHNLDHFFKKHAAKTLTEENKILLLRCLEMQRQAMQMFTSCGWFFDEISGLETDQILQYANRAIHYAEQISGYNLHPDFFSRLEKIPSNFHANGAVSYLRNVVPARVDLARVGMHYAASSLFEAYPEKLEIFNYVMESEVFQRIEGGHQRLAFGRTVVRSKVTLSEKFFSFAVVYLGQNNLIGHIAMEMKAERFQEMSEKLVLAFKGTELGDVVGIMQDYFGPERFSFWHLFSDEKRKILAQVTKESLLGAENTYREIYKDNYQLMTGIMLSNIPVPDTYLSAVKFVLNQDLRAIFAKGGTLKIRALQQVSDEFKKWGLKPENQPELRYVVSERVHYELQRILRDGAAALERMQALNKAMRIVEEIPLEMNTWKSQNYYFSKLKDQVVLQQNEQWLAEWRRLGQALEVKVGS